MRMTTDIPSCIEELALSGSISIGDCSRTTLYRWVKKINTHLEENYYDWRVKANPQNLTIEVAP